MHPDDIPKTAITNPFGLLKFTYMTFGLKNAVQTFQRFIHEVVFVYLGDVIIASHNFIEHIKHLTF